jgi:peptidoglycan/LPS O-acetylase OafA/YrhL
LITNFGKKVAQIAYVVFVILFVLYFIFSVKSLPNVNNFEKAGIIFLFFLPVILFIFVIRLVKSDYKKLFYNSIMVACFMLFLFLGLVLSENLRFLKANLPTAIFILIILYVLALKESKELLPETDLKLRELVSKLISCLNIGVPISVIIIIGLFNYSFANHSFACFVAVIIIIILNLLRKRNVENKCLYL